MKPNLLIWTAVFVSGIANFADAYEIGDKVGIVEGHGACATRTMDFGSVVIPPTDLLFAQFLIDQGLNKIGMANNFTIYFTSEGGNAVAQVKDGQRQILVDAVWASDLIDIYGSSAPLVAIIGHEIGHHANGHNMLSTLVAERELQADRFSSKLLEEIGYFEIDAVSYLKIEEDCSNPSSSYPSVSDRQEAIGNAFYQSCVPNCGFRRDNNPAAALLSEGQLLASYSRKFVDARVAEAISTGDDPFAAASSACTTLEQKFNLADSACSGR